MRLDKLILEAENLVDDFFNGLDIEDSRPHEIQNEKGNLIIYAHQNISDFFYEDNNNSTSYKREIIIVGVVAQRENCSKLENVSSFLEQKLESIYNLKFNN